MMSWHSIQITDTSSSGFIKMRKQFHVQKVRVHLWWLQTLSQLIIAGYTHQIEAKKHRFSSRPGKIVKAILQLRTSWTSYHHHGYSNRILPSWKTCTCIWQCIDSSQTIRHSTLCMPHAKGYQRSWRFLGSHSSGAWQWWQPSIWVRQQWKAYMKASKN